MDAYLAGCVREAEKKSAVSTALARQIIGIRQEDSLRRRARLFEHDLGTIEIAPLGSALVTGAVSGSVNSPRKP